VTETLLVATDLDRTLLPNGPQAESPGARQLFARLMGDKRIRLAYVTGRHRALVEEAIDSWSLPRPDRVISDVGSTIWTVSDAGAWERDASWSAAIGKDWAGHPRTALAERLKDVPGLVLQPEAQQNLHKLSYFLQADTDMETLEPRLRERLGSDIINARFVFSIDETQDQGLLDVLPRRASKRQAIEAVARSYQLDHASVLFCGDSGNDLDVLTSAIPAVLVANATAAVREAALAGARSAGLDELLYCARGGFLGMNGNYAAGILEGISHFQPAVLALLDEKALSDG